jgi:hypothetical protein
LLRVFVEKMSRLGFGGAGFVELGLDGIALARHAQFGEEGESLLQLLLFGRAIALRTG